MTNNPEPTEPNGDPDAEATEVTDSTPTTAEEAMDAGSDGEGFVDESAYTPANP